MPGSSATGVYWLALVLMAAGAWFGWRHGWPREALTFALLLLARALNAASPERVRGLLDGIGGLITALLQAIWRLVGAAPAPPPGGGPSLTIPGTPGVESLAALSLLLLLLAQPLGAALFPGRPHGVPRLGGIALGAVNGLLLTLALAPLLPADGLGALPERLLISTAGGWIERDLPGLVVGGTLLLVLMALVSGALPFGRHGR